MNILKEEMVKSLLFDDSLKDILKETYELLFIKNKLCRLPKNSQVTH